MLYDIYSGLSEEYKEYNVVQPSQIRFREPADDSERQTVNAIKRTVSKDTMTLLIIGVALIILGILVTFRSGGGIVLIFYGAGLCAATGLLKIGQNGSADHVATGVLIKKEKYNTGTHKHRVTHAWFLISVDDMEKTLCAVHPHASAYDEAEEGDRILVLDNSKTFPARKML